MGKAILIWQTPVLSGVKYGPLQYFIYHNAAKQFQQACNAYFDENNIRWKMELDDTGADIEQLENKGADLYVFVPGAKVRSWMYQNELEKTGVPSYYLESSEYYNKKIDKIEHFITQVLNQGEVCL